MKEIVTKGNPHYKWYEVTDEDGYNKTYMDYQSALDYLSYYHGIDYGETPEEREARLKAERRNNLIDELLKNKLYDNY